MKLIDNIKKGFRSAILKRFSEDAILEIIPDSTIIIESALRRGLKEEPASAQINMENTLVRVKNLNDWKTAVMCASDPNMPTWRALQDLHYNLMLDNHLASVIDTRILYVMRSAKRMVDKSGNENKEATELLERPWFYDLVKKALMSMYNGRKLIEMYELDGNGELARITEIPAMYFNSRIGVITKDPDGGSMGWNYRDQPYSNYYLQIGDNYDLGINTDMAPIVLAKKLAVGSYQDWVDKFGVPTLFITTDREDSKRLQQLYDAAVQFKKNGFMIGKGQETFTVGQTGGSTINPMESLAKFCNDEISKRVLGGTGLVSEKSFVGSAEIQFQLTKDRYESDKQFFKFLFNREIKSRLINLSPKYAAFSNLDFDWDSTESLSIDKLINAVNVLGNQFELDPEDIEAKTGIKILGQKMQSVQPAFGEQGGKKTQGL